MVKKQLFSARRGLAIILAAAMVMSHGVTALAEEDYDIDFGSGEVSDYTTDTDGETVENESKEFDSVSSSDGGAALTVTSSDGGKASATVDGDVTSTGQDYDYQNTGITASSSGEGSSTKVDVEGNVTSKRESGTSKGIEVTGDSDVDIDVKGSVTSEGDTAYGIFSFAGEGSDVTINVGGDVKAKGKYVETVQIERDLNSESVGKIEINVVGGGDVVEDGQDPDSHAVGLVDGSSDTADIDVTVSGDVIASNTAVMVMKGSSDSHIDLVVEGTVEGGKSNIVVSPTYDESWNPIEPKTENLSITVWKVDTSKTSGMIVENADGKQDATTEKVEKSINYIIKVDPVETSGGKLAVDKDPDSHGLYTGKQDEHVYLKVTVPSGYSVDSWYNVEGATEVNVVQDSSGNYYLVVPRGGGVNVGVKLKESGSSTNGVQNTSGESRTESGASDGEYWSPSSNNNNNNNNNNGNGNASGAMAGYAALQGLQVHSMSSLGTDMVLNVADVLMPVDTLTAINNFMGNNVPTLGSNNVMGAGVVNFNNMFLTSVSDTVEVPVAANVAANQSYTVMFSDGTQVVVPCLMNGVLSIPFNKAAEGLTYIIYGVQMDPSMFIGMPPAIGWTY